VDAGPVMDDEDAGVVDDAGAMDGRLAADGDVEGCQNLQRDRTGHSPVTSTNGQSLYLSKYWLAADRKVKGCLNLQTGVGHPPVTSTYGQSLS